MEIQVVELWESICVGLINLRSIIFTFCLKHKSRTHWHLKIFKSIIDFFELVGRIFLSLILALTFVEVMLVFCILAGLF